MATPLDPFHLTPAASLNRARILDLPGVPLPAEVPGKTGHDLLSSATLIEDLQARAPDLGLTAADLAAPGDLPSRFDGCFTATDPGVREAAEDLARGWGRRLACLVLMLKRGDPANRAARPDWDASYWTHWASVRTVWLGGGMVRGHLGAAMVQEGMAFLAEVGQADLALRRATHPAILPLIGAARSVPPGHPAALVFDFGSTAIKRALALYRGDALAALRLLPLVPSALSTAIGPLPPAEVSAVAQRMAALLVETWQDASAQGLASAPALVASMASYVADNQPLPAQGGVYMQVGAQVANLGAWLGEEAGRRLGRPLAVTLLHDGTAAARALAGEEQSAVIMLGTSLGVGFPPPAAYRPVAPDLRIDPG